MFRSFKLVGLILICTIGIFPSVVVACTGPATQSCHPCCAHNRVPQFLVAANDSAPLAPCCTVSSDKRAPATESRTQSGTARAPRPIATVAPLAARPSRPDLTTDHLQAASPPPAQAALCTFLI